MNGVAFPAWSAPDAEGVRTLILRGRNMLEGRRTRRRDGVDETVSTWLGPWRELAATWLRKNGEQVRWSTLLRQAGESRVGMAMNLLRVLLVDGWVELDERRDPRGQWMPVQLRWRHRMRLATLLGLPNQQEFNEHAEYLHGDGFADPRLEVLADTLHGRPAAQRLKRMQLLRALDSWIAADRQGTRRQFAYAARGDTKAISDREWLWLDEALGLPTLGIDTHTPGLWLRAPLCLHLPHGRLDLAAVPDAIALTPATLTEALFTEGWACRWRVLENRTSFEEAARAFGDRDGVLWLPGFAPSWWRGMVARLLQLAPAPLWVACDPDPAGVRIALGVAALWREVGLDWQPWHMSAIDLHRLPEHKPLSDYDSAEIARLRKQVLPPVLTELVEAMVSGGIKGEQEGLSFR